MDIAIVGRHTKVNESLRTRILERMDKITELAPRATRAEVHVCHERSPKVASEKERVEITLHGRGVVRSEASATDRDAAFDAAYSKLTAQLRKLHERKVHRHQGKSGLRAVPTPSGGIPTVPADDRVESVERWEGAPDDATREIPIDGTPILIRSKTHEGAPMTVAEAIDQMELVGHDFYLFHDCDADLPSAVYRRRGWTYGVIHLAAGAEDQSRESA